MLVAVAVAAAALTIGLQSADALRRLEFETVDVRFTLRGNHHPPGNIVIAAIDPRTEGDVGQRSIPRSILARMIDRLTAARASVIAYDLEFLDPTGPVGKGRAAIEAARREDSLLLTAIKRSRRVVVASSQIDRFGQPVVIGGADRLRRNGGAIGMASAWAEDPGGEVRRMLDSIGGAPGFAVEVVRRLGTARIDPAGFSDGAAWIDFRGPRGTFPTFSFSRVLAGGIPERLLRGKVVIVGNTDPAAHDFHAAPPSGDLMSGSELQANAIATLLAAIPLREAGDAVNYAIVLGLLTVILAVALWRSGVAALALAALAIPLYAVAVQAAFDNGKIVDFVYPVLGMAVCGVGSGAAEYFTEIRERLRMRRVFTRFVPEHVVDQVLSRTDDDLRLGGAAVDASVLFCDLRGFTTFAERTQPERVIAILNRYLTETSEAIRGHGGTVVAFLGDGVMAVFGAPLEQDDHADRAVAAGLEILELRLPALNRWLADSEEAGFAMGVGIASGTVMSGNVGAEWRVEYTAVGDTTNVAARLQEATKTLGHPLVLADETRARLNDQSSLISIGTLQLRGRGEAVTVWALEPRPPVARG